jgi:putative transposase
VVTLCWDTLRYSCLSPDDKTLELLLLRQQKRGPHLTHGEKFILVSLVEQLHHRVKLQKAHLAHLVLILKPETLLRWHRELVRRKWIFGNSPKAAGRPPTDPHLVQLIL